MKRPGIILASLSAAAFVAAAEAAPIHVRDLPVPGAVVEIQLRETSVDEMNPQMRHAYIVGIQEELDAHGYRPGPPDGRLGPRTRDAIRAYQYDAGLPVTGVASKEILDHMKFAQPRVFARGYRSGPPPAAMAPAPRHREPARSPVYVGLVEEVQIELNRRGYYEGAIDGQPGPRTRSAIAQFQIDSGLPITGVADQTLLQALLAADPSIRRN